MMGILGALGLAPRRDVEQAVAVGIDVVEEIEVTTTSEKVAVGVSATSREATVTLRGWARREVTLTGTQHGRTFVVDPLPTPRLPEDLHLEVLVPQDYAGTVAVRTSSGAVELDQVHAETVAVTTSSGAVRSRGVQGRTVTVVTSSGAVEASEVDGDLDVRTGSGAVTVRLSADAQFTLEANTVSGALRSTFPVTTTRTTMTGQVGTAGNDIMLHTSSGRITVETID